MNIHKESTNSNQQSERDWACVPGCAAACVVPNPNPCLRQRHARLQDAAAARKRDRAIKPGSFLSLLVNARHTNGDHLSELEAAAQAFTFLLAGALQHAPLRVR